MTVELPHPQSGQKAKFLISENPYAKNFVLEVQEMAPNSEEQSSWIVDKEMCSTGSLFVASPIDPLFILLPILEDARAKVFFFPPVIYSFRRKAITRECTKTSMLFQMTRQYKNSFCFHLIFFH
jgi:hypothetical protein